MPVDCRKIDGKWRLVDPDGKLERTSKGNPVDGGGHDTKAKCQTQKVAINAKS